MSPKQHIEKLEEQKRINSDYYGDIDDNECGVLA